MADLVKVILTKAGSLAAAEVGLLCGFKGDLDKLKKSVELIQAFLADAEAQGVSKEAVKLWLENLKDEAYRADNVLDEFAYEVARRNVEIRDPMWTKVCFFFSSSNPVLFYFRMAHKIKNINTSLFEINQQAMSFGLQAPSQVTVDHRRVSQVPGREANALLDQSEVVVARDADASDIVRMLTRPENQDVVSVLPIVGMAGLGKTTLAKLVYNRDEITRHFGSKIWVSVSDNFDVKRLLKEILETLTKEKCDVEIENVILEKLREKLGAKKYLLVLDDVWNENRNKWNDFKRSMVGVSTTRGNNILITTRSGEVARIVKTLPKYCVEPLSSEDCWSIFRGVAFANGGAPINSNLEDIGRQIAEKCNGVPLVAKLVGSMMISKDENEWSAILNDGAWSEVGDEAGVLPIIKLSFDHLSSPSLKHCFAYCSLFRKDSLMEKEQLIQLWMAQEYLQPKEGSNRVLEDIGNEYFESLLQSSLFQDIEKDEYDNITHCKMHDLVHDLSQLISKSDCSTQEDDMGKENLRVRHLALYCRRESNDNIQNESAERLRTLFLERFSPDRFLKFRYLRVLNLRDAYFDELPSSISKLVHLRYLDLSDSGIDSLPSSIVELYHLQTLRLGERLKIQEFPKNFKNLTSLRHLYLPWRNYAGRMVQMPHEIRWLTSLQTLPFFRVGKDKGFQIEELGYLKNLRGKIDIYDLQEVGSKEEAQKADLCGKKNIYKLSLNWKSVWNGNQSAEGVLEGLQPSPSLKGLDINKFPGDKLPLWMMKMAATTNGEDPWLPLNNLVTVRLYDCRRCEHMPILGRLLLLRDLELVGMDNVKCLGESFYGYDCHGSGTSHSSNVTKVLFPSLERFKISGMAKLEEWIELPEGSGVQAFPCLYELYINGRPQLKSAPSHFPLLKELRYWNVCSGLPLKKICSSKLKTLRKLKIERVDDLTSLQLFEDNKYLEDLEISNCPKLTQVPYLQGCDTTSCLRSLEIIFCKQLSNLPDGLNTHPSLEILKVQNCPNLNSIPSIQGLTSLRLLILSSCDGITCLPNGLESCTSLNTLTVEHCTNLTSFPDIQALCSLSTLKIRHCDKLTCLPRELQSCTSLNTLRVEDCTNLTSFPDIQALSSLSTLTIERCGKLTCLPKGIQFLTCLVDLRIGPFSEELDSFPSLDGVQHLHASLNNVTLYGCLPKFERYLLLPRIEVMRYNWDLIPEQLQHLSALRSLQLESFGMEALPDWFVKLSSLETLKVFDCQKLKYLPKIEGMQRLTKFRSLYLQGCPLLEERCERGGPEWPKVSHLRYSTARN